MGYDGAGARARATAHASGDEYHLCALVERLAYGVEAFKGVGPSLFGVAPGTQARAQLETGGHGRVVERLPVGVAHEEMDVVEALAVHVAHGVVAAAAHADDLDDGGGVERGGEVDEQGLGLRSGGCGHGG